MSLTLPEMEAVVKRLGRWPEYKMERDQLVKDGKTMRAASRLVIEKYIPDDVFDEVFESDELPETTADGLEIVIWVARNLKRKKILPKDAPDMAAYNLWEFCKTDPAFLQKFWGTFLTKMVPATREEEKEEVQEIDGTPQLRTIERLKNLWDKSHEEAGFKLVAEDYDDSEAEEDSEVRDSSEAEHRTHNPDVEGSIPSPATSLEPANV